MFDLQKRFDEIVNKLQDFGRSLKIEKEIENCITDILSEIDEKSRIIIRGGGIHTEQLLKMIDKKYRQEKLNIIAVVDDAMQGRTIYGIPVVSRAQGQVMDYDMVMVSSFTYAKEMCLDYDAEKIKVWNLYDDLLKRGYALEAPFYYYKEGTYEIPFHYLNLYEREPSKKNLEMVIDSLLVLKDFKTAFPYIQEYIDRGFDTEGIYMGAKEGLEVLLSEVKAEISARDGKDIVMFWIDSVPYRQLSWLPFVYSKKDSSCFFEKAYSTVPYTHPIMHAFLQGALRIEDYDVTENEINETNSEVLQNLQKAGYEFIYIGYSGGKHIPERFQADNSFADSDLSKIASACKVYWELLCQLSGSSKPLFCIAHSVCETHDPFLGVSLWKNRSYKWSEIVGQRQDRKSYEYLNGQLEFYADFLSEGITKIYMSDHGSSIESDIYVFAEPRIHAFFLIEGKKVPVKKINKIFGYIDFRFIMKYLLYGKEEYLLKALNDYALIEEVDVYNANLVNHLLQEGLEEYGMSFRGVVTEEDKYVRLSNGKEFYFKLPDESENLAGDIRFSERVSMLSEIAGDIYLDINKYPEFAYSKKLYAKQ